MGISYRGKCVGCGRTSPLDAAEGIGICPACKGPKILPEDEPGISKATRGRRLIARAAKRLFELGDGNFALKLCDHFELKIADAPPGRPPVDSRQGR